MFLSCCAYQKIISGNSNENQSYRKKYEKIDFLPHRETNKDRYQQKYT